MTDDVESTLAEVREYTDGWRRQEGRPWRPFDQEDRIRHWGAPGPFGITQSEEFNTDWEAWQEAHGHTPQLKCYPEFGCQVLESYPIDLLLRMLEVVDGLQPRIDEAETQLAYIGAGCLNADRDELVRRITAVGAERYKVGDWLADRLDKAREAGLVATREAIAKALRELQHTSGDVSFPALVHWQVEESTDAVMGVVREVGAVEAEQREKDAVDAEIAELREVAHWECNCVPNDGPPHCHACGEIAGHPVAWANAVHGPAAVSREGLLAQVRALDLSLWDSANPEEQIGLIVDTLLPSFGTRPPTTGLHDPWDANCIKNGLGEPSKEGARCTVCRPAYLDQVEREYLRLKAEQPYVSTYPNGNKLNDEAAEAAHNSELLRQAHRTIAKARGL